MGEIYLFSPPPEAPVFRPTLEEFADPLAYIQEITPVAEQYGICKIIPPAGWDPPFSADVDGLRFTPRVQRLNELDCRTRVKLNFLEKIARFRELEGLTLKIPLVNERPLDLYTLFKSVEMEGGYDEVKEKGKWDQICTVMGFPTGTGLEDVLRMNYEKFLYSYEIFINANKKGTHLDANNGQASPESSTESSNVSNNKSTDRMEPDSTTPDINETSCHNCNSNANPSKLLECYTCKENYHTYCLNPVVLEPPDRNWFCPQCVMTEIIKTAETFGFEQAEKTYSLQQFGEMADKFKAAYFKESLNGASTWAVESEFWRIVSSFEEDVTVEYGADLHTLGHGSGFPVRGAVYGQEYIESGWNLNNISILEGSALRFIEKGISGMTIPWLYIGMCFSTFCWHIEDHWTYSINYLHWGEPKTWYGVPGTQAELFEYVMKTYAPELFQNQPDLLHQLVTIMNPNTLAQLGVTVSRIDQYPGEFVITFPRAYHAGFNQGYNFAEAVNFAPPNWIEMGRSCMVQYAKLRRPCVFSHDELICKMASSCGDLTITEAAAVYMDLLKMIEIEIKLRDQLKEAGVYKCKRVHFETKDDDQRVCAVCKTTCFVSAVVCECDTDVLLCLKHYDHFCECPRTNLILLYRYQMEEFVPLLKNLQNRAEAYDTWLEKVKNVLNLRDSHFGELLLIERDGHFDLNTITASTLEDLKVLRREGEYWLQKGFDNANSLKQLKHGIAGAEIYVSILRRIHLDDEEVEKLMLKPIDENSLEEATNDERSSLEIVSTFPLSVAELRVLMECAKKMYFVSKERIYLFLLIKQANNLDSLVRKYREVADLKVQQYLNQCKEELKILPGLKTLEKRCAELKWMCDFGTFISLSNYVNVNSMADKHVFKELKRGLVLEKRVNCFLKDTAEPRSISDAEQLIKEAEDLRVCSPALDLLIDQVNKSNELLLRCCEINTWKYYPFLATAEDLLKMDDEVLFLFEGLVGIRRDVKKAKLWLKEMTDDFCKSASTNLLEVISPRNFNLAQVLKDQINKNDNSNSEMEITDEEEESVRKRSIHSDETFIIDLESSNKKMLIENADPSTVRLLFKKAAEEEFARIKKIRAINISSIQTSEMDKRCGLCKGYFHNAEFNKLAYSKTHTKLLCSDCLRTKRPNLTTVLHYLHLLMEIKLRLHEGEALQFLAERIFDWLNSAEMFIKREDVSRITNKIHEIGTDHIKNLKEYNFSLDKSSLELLENILIERDLLEVNLEGNKMHTLISIICNNFMENENTENPVNGINSDENSNSPSVVDLNLQKEASVEREVNTETRRRMSINDYKFSKERFKKNLYNNNKWSRIFKKIKTEQYARKRNKNTRRSKKNFYYDKSSSESSPSVYSELTSSETAQFTNTDQSSIEISNFTISSSSEADQPDSNELSVTTNQTSSEISYVTTTNETNKETAQFTTVNQISGETSRTAKTNETIHTPLTEQTNSETSGATITEQTNLEISVTKNNSNETVTVTEQMDSEISHTEKNNKTFLATTTEQTNTEITEGDIVYNQDECAAVNCLNPCGDRIFWVQCDGPCDKWFHLACIGLTIDNINLDEEFICKTCSGKKSRFEIVDIQMWD